MTDDKPLLKLYSTSCSELPTRVHRWSLRFQEFDFELEYELGVNNTVEHSAIMLFQTLYLKL